MDTLKTIDEMIAQVAKYYAGERRRIASCPDPSISIVCQVSLADAEKSDLAVLAAAGRIVKNIQGKKGEAWKPSE